MPSLEEPTEASELYGENYYAHHCGLAYERNDHWLGFFGRIAGELVSTLAPQKTLDMGCAFGFLVEALRDRGVDAHGYDISEYAIGQVGGSAVGYCSVRSALLPIPDRYDLITCVEVIEHLDPVEGRQALEQLCAATDRLLLSTTPYDYGEPTHVNVQPPEYWTGILASLGFFRDVDYDASFLTPWAGLYVRREPTLVELAKAYERSEWRHRSEAIELRRDNLRLHEMTAEVEGVAAGASDALDLELARAHQQLAASEDQLEQVRERLVGAEDRLRTARDAAAGAEAARGRAEADLQQARTEIVALRNEQELWDEVANNLLAQGAGAASELAETKDRLEAIETSTTWRLSWLALAPYRRLRGRR